MSQALCFNDVQFEIISRNGQPWITARQLSQALGYAREDSVLKIYERNKEEFSSMMSATVKMTVGLTEVVARIFSMRGCHLVGMLSRTPVAKAFRRWVLDVLDRLAAEERAALPEVPHIAITPSTTASRKPLRALVHAWAQVSGTPHTALWPQVKAHFQLERIDDLPEEWIPDALEWVQGKIDNLTPALPVSAPLRTPLLSLSPDDLAALDRAAQRVEELNRHVMKEIGELHVEILERVDLRRVQFPAWEVLSEFIFYSLFRAAELPSGSLEREKNPALALKMLAGALGNR